MAVGPVRAFGDVAGLGGEAASAPIIFAELGISGVTGQANLVFAFFFFWFVFRRFSFISRLGRFPDRPAWELTRVRDRWRTRLQIL
jgi:hypothetical protein